jgi:hypothetical protein
MGPSATHSINIRIVRRIFQTQPDYTITLEPCERLQGIECRLQLQYVDMVGAFIGRPGLPGACFTINSVNDASRRLR